jgi:hypothetical protein
MKVTATIHAHLTSLVAIREYRGRSHMRFSLRRGGQASAWFSRG